MNYSDFFKMIPEASLVAILIVLFVADFVTAKTEERKWFNPLASVLLLLNTFVCLIPMDAQTAFGGMYVTSSAVDVMKAILSMGTFIVILQSRVWAAKSGKEGEFYMLIVSTLLGMFAMMSAGNFLMFFLGLEMASVPLACAVAFDMYRKNSAEAAAKFILTATFSSGVMLYGISFLYGEFGTLYFADITAKMQATPLTIMGLVFFFSGLGFKISLVPFHFWTADTYQGAPTTVTGYLSVISKGAAAFTLLSILFHVFGGIMEYWHVLLMIVVVLSITIANLFAVRQSELTNPRLSFLMTLAMFSLGGIPPFAGMFSKFFVFMSGVNGANINTTMGAWAYGVVFIALLNTVISLYYYLKIVKAMYIVRTDSPLPSFKSDCNTKFALAVCMAGILLFGVCSFVYEWIATAA